MSLISKWSCLAEMIFQERTNWVLAEAQKASVLLMCDYLLANPAS